MAPNQQLLPVCLRHWLTSRALVAGLALACFANSCRGNFVFDDSEAISNNKDVDPEATSISQVFSHDFWGGNISLKTSHKSYRPLTVLTFRLNFWLAGGRHPFIFHLFNVLLHPFVCLLLMDVITCWSYVCQSDQEGSRSGRTEKERRHVPTVPLITALLFAVHPIHTESVSSDQDYCCSILNPDSRTISYSNLLNPVLIGHYISCHLLALSYSRWLVWLGEQSSLLHFVLWQLYSLTHTAVQKVTESHISHISAQV